MILFACFLCSVSAAFEFQLVSEEYKTDELCNGSQVAENASLLADNQATLKSPKHNDSSNFDEDKTIMSHHRLVRSLDSNAFLTDINSTDDSFDYSKLTHKISHNPTDDHYDNDSERGNATSSTSQQTNHNTCPTVSDFYRRVLKGLQANVSSDNKTLWSLGISRVSSEQIETARASCF